MTTYYDDMSESAALNYLAGLEDAGDLAALRQLALDISAGTVAGALSVSGAITGGSTGAFTGAVTAAGVTSSAAVQAAAASGFVVGASGPKILSGTGSPEGVVTAPIGSQWIDTAATTGAIKWIKASGTGNTGWVVEYGDTGWRGVTTWTSGGVVTGASLHADSAPTAATAGGIYVRRVNGTVQLFISGLTTTGTSPVIYASGFLSTGWRMTNAFGNVPCSVNGAMRMVGNFIVGGSGLNAGGGLTGTTNWGIYDGHAMWPTNDAWPSSLPGAAATLSVP